MTLSRRRPLHLDRNENLYGPAPQCLKVLGKLGSEELSVYSRDFARGVKNRLSERLSADLGIPEERILLSEGSEDMLKQVVHCYLGPGKTLLCPEQSWWYYTAVASEVGAKTAVFSLRQETERFSYDVREVVEQCRKTSPGVVLIASPNNPTGNSIDDGDLERIVDACRGSVVVLDEAYWGFSDKRVEHLAGLTDRYENLLVLRTFSKYYALAGVRIAFAVAGSGLGKLAKFASRYLGYNRISEELALAALDAKGYYRTAARSIREDRTALYRLFDNRQGFVCYRSDANFVLVRIPKNFKAGLRSFLSSRNIVIKFFDEREFSSFVRITIGTRSQSRSLRIVLKEFLEDGARR